MNAIFAKILYELEKRRDLVLVSIVSQEGSSPRGLGAQMLVGREGRILGTVGGGAVEKLCEETALECLVGRVSRERFFTLRPNSNEDIGMVCGGDVSAWFQFIDSSNPEWTVLAQKLLAMLAAHQPGWFALDIQGGFPALTDADGRTVSGSLSETPDGLAAGRYFRSEKYFYMPLPLRERAVIFGGGHCTQALVPFLSKVGFRVTVMENRPEYARPELFPEAEAVIYGDYTKLSDYLDLKASDYIVIMTNGHSHDLDVQRQVLEHPPVYVGVIGSKSKKAFVNQKLREAGIPDAAIAQVHSPIGTAIKAVTPEEIAVSITGEMILERARLRESCGIAPHGCPMH